MARASEEAEEEDDSQVGEELKTFQSVSAWYNFLAMDRPDFFHSVKDLMRKMASQAAEISLPSKSSTLHNQTSKNGMQIPMDRTGQEH